MNEQYKKRLIELAKNVKIKAWNHLSPSTNMDSVELLSDISFLVGYIEALKEDKDK